MPTYDFEDTKTGEVFEKRITIAERDKLLQDNPHYKQLLSMPKIVSGTDGLRKPDDSFRDILREVDNKHKGARKGNSMNKHSDF